MTPDDVRRIEGGRAMDAEDRHGYSAITTEASKLADLVEKEATALAKIMENAELIAALARAERERIAQLVENFPIRDNSTLITRIAMAKAIRDLG